MCRDNRLLFASVFSSRCRRPTARDVELKSKTLHPSPSPVSVQKYTNSNNSAKQPPIRWGWEQHICVRTRWNHMRIEHITVDSRARARRNRSNCLINKYVLYRNIVDFKIKICTCVHVSYIYIFIYRMTVEWKSRFSEKLIVRIKYLYTVIVFYASKTTLRNIIFKRIFS